MKIIAWICRLLLGAGFVVFGINYFIPFLPMPPQPQSSEIATAWVSGLANAPHYLAMVKIVEILGGALVLTGIALPLGLVLLAPLVINIVYFNSYLLHAPSIDLVLLVSGLVLAFINRDRFKSLFC